MEKVNNIGLETHRLNETPREQLIQLTQAIFDKDIDLIDKLLDVLGLEHLK